MEVGIIHMKQESCRLHVVVLVNQSDGRRIILQGDTLLQVIDYP